MTVRRMVALNNVKLDPADGAHDRSLPERQSGTRARRAPAWALRDRAADDRVSLHRRSAHRDDVPRLPFDGARDHAASHAERMGAARRHASRALPGRRLPGVPSRRSGDERQRAGPASDGRRDQSSRARVPAAHARVDRVVGDDAAAASRGHVAAERQRAGTRRLLWTADRDARNGATASSSRRRPIAMPTAARSCSATDNRSSTPAFSGAAGRPTPRCAPRDTVGLREVMFVEPGWEEMSGRWFTGGYEEIGMDVSLKKLGANPVRARRRAARDAGRNARRRTSRSSARTCRERRRRRRSTSDPA